MAEAEERARVGKLDDLLLSLSSASGILISLFQAVLGGADFVVVAIPILIVGWALPIYVGYFKGALQENLQERIRGWLFLIIGAIGYVVFSCFQLSVEYLKDPSEGALPYLVVFVIFWAVAAIVYAIPKITLKLTLWVYSVHSKETDDTARQVAGNTASSAFLLSCALSLLIRFVRPQDIDAMSTWAAIFLASLLWGLIYYRVSWSWSVISRNFNAVGLHALKKHGISRAKRILIRLIEIGVLVSLFYGAMITRDTVVSSVLGATLVFVLLNLMLVNSLKNLPAIEFYSREWNKLSDGDRKNTAKAAKQLERMRKIVSPFFP
jgi:hypothetical protein